MHIPFCEKKCAYCDFYSAFKSEEMLSKYADALTCEIKKWGGNLCRPIINTVYFGGGTPSLLMEKIIPVMNEIKASFVLAEDAEITLEVNPSAKTEEMLRYAKEAGVNRLSIGAQSGDDKMLSLLGRSHNAEDTVLAVNKAREMGFSNISLDLMLGLPESNKQTLKKDLDFVLEQRVEHISAYILKIEENTRFYRENISLPSDDETAEQYIFMCDYLKQNGYDHYEISNFALKNKESRHNLKYWNCEEYLGIGPSAHSFINGKRFYMPRDMKSFFDNPQYILDGSGGDKSEYIMLRLRLKEGLKFSNYEKRFGKFPFEKIKDLCSSLQKSELLKITDEGIFLTDNGMLISNTIIAKLLEEVQ